MTRSRMLLRLLAVALASALAASPAGAQGRAETLRYVTGGVVNSLDPVMLGATPEANALSTSTYDRLLRFGRKPAGDGAYVFDDAVIEGELAESHAVSADGLLITLKLRQNALWHDGSPVTAADVKWSLDRAVSANTMSKAQASTGSLTNPDQIRVVDVRTVEIKLAKPDRLAIRNLATTYLPMYNAKLARQHATADDPWATAWLKENTAGGGAYTVQDFRAGKQVVLARNEGWTNGTKPAFRRVIVQTVPEAATRSALVEKGDADLAIGLGAEDLKALESSRTAKVVSTPMPTGFVALVFNTQMAPFDKPQVRRALALAIPYEAIFKAALDGRGTRLFGATWAGEPPTADFPQPLPLRTDPDLARTTLAEAGFPDGFETSLSFGVIRTAFAEPAAALIQEAFGGIGVKVKIEKLPDPQMAAAVTEKRLPMLLERSFALFPSTEYFFRVFASGPSRWNLASWNDTEVNGLLPRARHEADPAKYDAVARKLVGLIAADVPMAFLARPTFDVAMARSVKGFTTWSNYYPDFRDLSRE